MLQGDTVSSSTEPTSGDVSDLPAAILQRVRAAVDKAAPAAHGLLRELINVRSVNPRFPGVTVGEYAGGEQRCNEILAERLRDAGAQTHWVEAERGRANLVGVVRGTGGGRSLALNGHVDTVAPLRAETWSISDPWRPEERDGVLYGLGGTDMKAGLAAMWLAAVALRDAGIVLAGDLHLHAVVGEETMSHDLGTSAVLDAGFMVDGAIVAEPSSTPVPLTVAHTAAGNLNVRMTVRGKATHWGNRARAIRPGYGGDAVGVNAVEKAAIVLAAVRELEERWGRSKSHPLFAPGFFIIHPGVFHGDVGIPAPAFFPDEAFIHYLLWYPPQEAPADVIQEIEEHVRAATRGDSWLRENPVEFEWLGNWPAADTALGSPFVQDVLRARRDAIGPAPAANDQTGGASFGAASDASFYEQRGIPSVVCGPGDILFAHSADENVRLAEVAEAAKIFAAAAIRWCGLAGM
jgi:acetylornithine deacetylase